MFAVSKNGCVGSAGLELCKCLHKAEHFYEEAQAYLSCSKVMTHTTFPRLVE